MNKGWVKLNRKSLKSSVWQNSKAWTVWCWCLMKAAHEPTNFPFNGKDIEIKPGQFVTGREKAVKELTNDFTPQKYRTAINYLKSTNRITIKTTNHFTLITIVNWSKYQSKEIANQQSNQQTNQPLTNQQPTTNQQTNHIQEDKEIKNVKNIYIFFQEKINSKSLLTEEAKRKIKTRLSSFTETQLKAAINNFSSSSWWMENNAHRGVSWFFKSDDRIDQFLNLKETNNNEEVKIPDYAQRYGN